MMTPGGQYRQNTMPQVYRNYIDGGASGGAGGQQRRFKNLEDIVCFKVGSTDKISIGPYSLSYEIATILCDLPTTTITLAWVD